MKKWFFRLLPIILSLGGLAILISRLNLADLLEALEQVNYGYFALSFLLALLTQFFPPWRWGILLNYRISFWHSCTSTFTGDFVNAITPLRMGEVVRAGLIRRSENIPMGEALSSIVLSQILDMLSLMALGVILLLNAPVSETLLRAGVIMGALGVVGIVALFFMARSADALEKRLEPLFLRSIGEMRGTKMLKRFRHLLDGLQALKSPVQLAYSLLVSLVMWLILALSGWVLLMGMMPSPSWTLGIAVGFAGGVGRLIPALPGSIGTLDFAVMLSLTTLGVTDDTAIAFTLLLRLRYILITLVTGTTGLIAEGMSLSGLRQWVSAPKP
jgi:glycosyltransferase 2 family protein